MKKLLSLLRTYFPILVVAGAFVWSATSLSLYRVKVEPPGAIKLRIGHWQLEPGVRTAFDEMAREYRKTHPNVYIVQDAIPETTYGQWVTTQVMGGTAPDMIEIGKDLTPALWISYLNRYFIPLGKVVGAPNPYNQGTDLEGVPLQKTYKENMRSAYVPELQEYMNIPLAMFGVRIFYNKDLLRKLTGLETPPRNYRDFLATCEKIKDKRDSLGKNYIPIACSKFHMGWWEGMMCDPMTHGAVYRVDFNRDGFVGNDELFVGFKAGLINLHFPNFKARFQMERELIQEFETGFTGLTRDEAVFLFAQQRAVFMSTGTWDSRSLQEQAKGQFEVGVMDFPMPAKDDPEFGSVSEGPIYENPGVGFNFGITRASKHPEIALDFLLFLASKKGNEKLNRIIGWIPGIRGTEMDPSLKAFEPHLEGVFSAMPFQLGGETSIKWNQLTSLYQVNQISFDDFAKQYEDFYRDRGMEDYKEVRKDWRRGLQKNEQFLAGIRTRAMAASGDEAKALWIKYRLVIHSSLLWNEIGHAEEDKMIAEGVSPHTSTPYEYTPEVIQKIRDRWSGPVPKGSF